MLSHADTADAGHNRVVTFKLTGLEADTSYYYAVRSEGVTDLERRGRFRTFPEGRASFTFAYASCARTGSSNQVFGAILESQPLFYMNIGDFHYLNITNDDREEFRRAYDVILSSPTQSRLYRYVPFVYMWDDHDYGGNSSGRLARSRIAARVTYREYVPHYPLPAGEGDEPIYQAFNAGRARFILTDLRSERSPSGEEDGPLKSMMGSQQKAWFKRQLLDAKGKFPLIFWVSTVPWNGTAGVNYYPGIGRPQRREDHWSVYATERAEIADFIKSNHITGVCILHGDSHMLAADDGSNSDYATGGGAPIPVMCAAPLDQSPSTKGGPYSQGIYRPSAGDGCYGWVRVNDFGNHLTVSFSGRNYKNEEKISLRFDVKP